MAFRMACSEGDRAKPDAGDHTDNSIVNRGGFGGACSSGRDPGASPRREVSGGVGLGLILPEQLRHSAARKLALASFRSPAAYKCPGAPAAQSASAWMDSVGLGRAVGTNGGIGADRP
jgi:hypothetical protein